MAAARSESKPVAIRVTPIQRGKEAGWVRAEVAGVPVLVELRLVEREGRVRIVALHLDWGEGIDATTLRQIPLGQIEAQANVSDTPGTVPGTWRHARAVYPINRAKQAAAKIKVPEKKPYPNEFYQSVATAYRLCIAASMSPGPTIAGAKGVPLTQVHGWIRIARAKGLLAAGQIGKAG
jgi:hypothetical protein